MKTNFEFISALFNKAEKMENIDNCNNYQANFYKVEICNNNNLQIESGCITEFGERFFNDNVRECTPSYKEFKKLLKISNDRTVFFVYED